MPTPERIKQIQVEVLMRIMMGEYKKNLFSDVWDQYASEAPAGGWYQNITGPMIAGGLVGVGEGNPGGVTWVITKDGEEFVKNYSAESVAPNPAPAGTTKEK